CSQIDSAIDVNRQIGVHLNHAAIITLVPVVATPWLVSDVFDRETFVRRQFHMRKGAGPAFLDCELKYSIEFLLRNHEWFARSFVTLPERSCPRNPRFDLIEDILKMRLRERRRDRVVKAARFFVEVRVFALRHSNACLKRRQLSPQIFVAKPARLIHRHRNLFQRGTQLHRLASDGMERLLLLLPRGFPVRRPLNAVPVTWIMLAPGEAELKLT